MHLKLKKPLAFPDPIVNLHLKKLAAGIEEKELLAIHEGGEEEKFFIYAYLLEQLKAQGLLSYEVFDRTNLVARLVPSSTSFRLGRDVISNKKYQLSKFCFCRRLEEVLILETPLCAAKIEIHNRLGFLLLFELHHPISLAELSEQVKELSQEAIHDFFLLLFSAQMLTEWTEGENMEKKTPVFLQWEFHDLLFHARSRLGRHDYPSGGLYPFRTKIPSLPPTKSLQSSDPIALYVPDLEKLKNEDPSLTLVLEKRRSKREQGHPVSAAHLGEFLFRSARIQSMEEKNGRLFSYRVYPGGGAKYPLEIYPLIHSCEGLAKGLYHYDPQRHLLEKWTEPNDKTEKILTMARDSAGKKELPQVLFLISCRFQRISWKYQSMAYATVLKDVGALIQTFYLVATAMHLSPSAIGAGDSDLFASVARLNYYEETSVGEFILS